MSTIDALKAKVEVLKELFNDGTTEAGRNVILTRETKIEANAQEVENFLWHLENYFKHRKVRDDESKINTAVL